MKHRWLGVVGTLLVIPTLVALGRFESALRAGQSTLRDETLWFRMVAGGTVPRYVRLRPRASLSTIIQGGNDQGLPDGVDRLIARTTVEILNLRPTMSYGLTPVRP